MKKQGPSSDADSPEQIVSDAIDRQLSTLAAEIFRHGVPSTNQLEELERLSKLHCFLLGRMKRPHVRGRVFAIFFVLSAVVILLSLAYRRVSSSAVELDVKAANIEVDLTDSRENLLIPGELDEVLPLSHAEISGIETSDGPLDLQIGETLTLRTLQPARQMNMDLAVRFQQLGVPKDGPFSLNMSTAYAPGGRGLILTTAAPQPSSAHFAIVVPRNPSKVPQSLKDATAASDHIFNAVSASGRNLRIEMYPAQAQHAITILRNVEVKAIRFHTSQADEGSSILNGSAQVRDLGNSILIQSGDEVMVAGARLRVRELTFKDGQFQVSISSPSASLLFVGADPPRNVMPTLFERISARWPTQLYATLSAIVVLWIALAKWWKGTE